MSTKKANKSFMQMYREYMRTEPLRLAILDADCVKKYGYSMAAYFDDYSRVDSVLTRCTIHKRVNFRYHAVNSRNWAKERLSLTKLWRAHA